MRLRGFPVSADFEPEERKSHRPSAFDILTKIALPLALAIFALLQEQQTRFLALIGFAVLSFVVGLYQPIHNFIVESSHNYRENRFARKHFPQFRNYVTQFGEFVRRQNSDTLHFILLSELCGNNSSEFEKFYVPPIRLFDDRWHFLKARLDRDEETLQNFQHYVSEFGSLIDSFSSSCVFQVFDRLPPDFRINLRPDVKRSLNLFQQKYASFLQDYMKFMRTLESALPRIQFSATYFSLPKPL